MANAKITQGPKLTRREEELNGIYAGARANREREMNDDPTDAVTDQVVDDREVEPEVGHEVDGDDNCPQNPPSVGIVGEGEEDTQLDTTGPTTIADEPRDQSPEPDQDLVTILVDGEEQQVPRSRVLEQGVRTLQKEAAADKRLAEATKIYQRAELLEAQQAQRLQQAEDQLRQVAERQNQGAPLSPQQDADVKQKARELATQLLDGDEEQVTDALAEVLSKGRQEPTQQINPNQIADQAVQAMQQKLDYRDAMSTLKDEFPKLFEDQILFNMADNISKEFAQEEPGISLKDLILKSGRYVKSWYDEQTGGLQQPTKPEEGVDKTSRKRTVKNIPTASARLPVDAPKRPPTPSEIVANMRSSRGLPATG